MSEELPILKLTQEQSSLLMKASFCHPDEWVLICGPLMNEQRLLRAFACGWDAKTWPVEVRFIPVEIAEKVLATLADWPGL